MKLEDFKNEIDNIKPDPYMETRLSQKVIDLAPKKRSKRKLAVAAVSGFLSLAVLTTGLGFGAFSRNNENLDKMFVMSVRAADSDDPDYIPLDKDSLVLQDYKITAGYNEYGTAEVYGDSETSFYLKGENIKSVSYSCETGYLMVFDWDLYDYLVSRNEYYEVIAPYTDEYSGKNISEQNEIMHNHIENGDYDNYLVASEKKFIGEYAFAMDFISYHDVKEYGIKLGFDIDESVLSDMSIVAVGVPSWETYYKIFPSINSDIFDCVDGIQHYTFQNLFDKTEGIGTSVSWHPNIYNLLDDPEIPLSEIPSDTVTVEVMFNDGTVQIAKYDFSFNNNGELIIKTLA